MANSAHTLILPKATVTLPLLLFASLLRIKVRRFGLMEAVIIDLLNVFEQTLIHSLGGALAIRHGGSKLIYDWSNRDASCIEWAAFYTNSDHGVGEVQSGHRITLTYNLYVIHRCGRALQSLGRSLESPKLILYDVFKDMLQQRGFMPNGNKTLIFFLIV